MRSPNIARPAVFFVADSTQSKVYSVFDLFEIRWTTFETEDNCGYSQVTQTFSTCTTILKTGHACAETAAELDVG